MNFFFYTSELQWSLDTPQVQKDIMNTVLNLCQVCFIAPVRQQIAFYRMAFKCFTCVHYLFLYNILLIWNIFKKVVKER